MRLLPKDPEIGWTPYAWLIYLSFFIATPAVKRYGATSGEWAVTIAAVVVFLALYFRGYWVHGRQLVLIIAAITALGAIYYPFNPGAGCFFIYAAAFAAWIGTARSALYAILAIEAVVLAEILIFRVAIWNAIWPPLFVALLGGTQVHYAQAHAANSRLRRAHAEIEHLAKVAERERIARDLHDLLGHTLSVIILKSELASKLAERDPERARDEIRDVERISRDALAQVRNAVRGYRSGGLQAEVDMARQTLDAAGVSLVAEIETMQLPAAHEAVLALAIREAVTNVVRHARAKQCHLTLQSTPTGCTLMIADDGRGGTSPFGSGLTGMQERIEALGGTLRRDGARGTTLTLKVPLPAATTTSITGERSA